MSFRVSAHRGNTQTSEKIGNTLGAIKDAEKIGVDMVEFDVRLTQDNKWILYHDKRLKDTELLIKNLKYKEIKSELEKRNRKLSTLQEVLTDIYSVSLNIECKPRSMEAGYKLCKTILKYRDFENIGISTFSRKALQGVRKAHEDAKLSLLGHMLPRRKWKKFHKKFRLYSINPNFKSLTILNGPKKIRRTRNHNIETHVWGTNTKKSIMRIAKLGVDVIATDYPELAMKIRDKIKSNQ